MSAKNLQVNLLFNANTTQAQQNIQQLSNMLHQISNMKTGFAGGSLSQAAKDAQALAGHLANAVNAKTGKLDLTRLSSSLASAKTNLNTLTSSLQAAGPVGQQAFLKIATAISQAEAPMFRMSASMRNLLTTIGNTAKWQIASSAIHGLTGAISESISYIERFDKALTDIKMVSDLNNDQLLKYAENTRRIAKAVNATALEVAQGSTLYFQQGLSDAETEKRIMVTQKLANVTGETAEKVTAEMTAIWNNFADGNESLESYADKLSYLGAKTAATNSQISNAMQKFAASAKVVGLSYDYAATAVAQVIDRTQMGAEEVGTAFKTILSRIQGLKLGETLEDGVDLNKYGQALDVVGVKILDANDQLRDADDILKDLGGKWDTLDSAQKKALATTVAGLRQQTQFMALMEEWDDIEAQVSDLSQATGYLAKQNEDYANSVAGIKKRYEETKNALFDAILDESTLKGFYSSMEGVLKTVTKIVDTMGGLGPILLTIAGLFSKQLIPIMASGVANFVANIQTAFGITESKVKQIQADFDKQLQIKIDSGQLDSYQAKQAEVAQMLIREKQRLLEISKSASSIEKEQINNQIALLEMQGANVQKAYEEAAVLDRQLKTMSNQVIEATKKQNALNSTTFDFKNSTKKWTTEDASHIENMANLDSATFANKKSMAVTNKTVANEELATLVAEKGALEKEIPRLQAELQARMRQKEAVELLESVPEGEAQEARASFSKDLGAAIPDTLQNKKGTLTNLQGVSSTKIDEEILAIKNQIAEKQEELNKLSQDNGPIKVAQDKVAAAREELKMLKEAEGLKRKAQSEALTTTKDTKVAGMEYGLLSTEATGDSEEGTEIARQAIASIGHKRGEAEGAESLKLTTDEVTGDRVVNTDTESSIANFEALKQKQGELIEKSEQYKRGIQDINGVMAQLKTSETEVTKAIIDHGASSKTTQRAQKAYEKQLQQTRASAKAFGKDLASSLNQIKGDKAAAEIAEINTALEKIEATDDVKEIEQAFQAIIRITDQLGTEFQQAAGIVGGAAEQMANNIAGNSDEAKAKLEALGDTAMQEGQQTAQAGQQFSQFSQTIKDGENAPVTFASKLQGTVTSMASFASSCQMALSGMQVFMSAFEEGASPMQRFTAIMSGLSMLLPVVAAAIGLVDKAQKAETKSTIQSMIAKWAENAAWYASPVLWIPLIIMAAIAAIALLIGWIVNMTNALSASEQAYENAKQELETATAAYEQAAAAAQEFKEAVSNYEDAVDGIKGLTEGTLEYAEAVRKANEEAIALIEMNEGLAGKYHVNEQGLITFDEGALEEAQRALMNKQYDAAFMKAKAEKKVIDTGHQVQEENIREKAEYSGYVQTGTYSNGRAKEYKDIGTEFFNDFQAHLDSKTNDGERQAAKTTNEIRDFIIANAQAKGLTLDETQINTLTDKLQESSGSLDKLKTTTDAQIEAVKANTKALLKEQYGDAVDKYGEAAVYGAKEILGDKMAQDFNGTGKTATDYFKENHAGGTTNNLKNLRDEDSAVGTILQEAFELSDEDMAKGEIKISDDGFVTITSTTNDDDVIKRISTEEFDKIMAGGTVSEADILAYLGGGDANIQAAENEAINDGILDYSDTLIRGKEYGSYEGLTAGTYEDIYNKGAKLTGEDAQVFQEKVQNHLAQFSGQEKEAIAKAINNLDTGDVIKGNLDELLEKDYSKIFADSLKMPQEAFDQYTDEIIKNNKALEGNRAAAAKAAKGAIESERRFKKLGEVYGDLKDNLVEGKRGTEDFSTACAKMADGLNAAFGEDTFDADFVANNLDMVKRAMEGDIAAINQLYDIAGQEILIEAGVDLSDGTIAQEVNDWIGSQQFNDLKLGATLDSTGMTDTFNDMFTNGEIWVDDMNKLLKGVGFDPVIDYKEMPIDEVTLGEHNQDQEVEVLVPDESSPGGFKKEKMTLKSAVKTHGGSQAKVMMPYIKGGDTIKTSTPKNFSNGVKSGNPKNGGSGSGSGSSSKPAKKSRSTKKTDIVDRYKETNDQLNKIKDTIEDTSREMDTLWGPKRLAAMDKYGKSLQKQIQTQGKYKQEIVDSLAIDKKAVQDFMKEMPNGEIGGLGDMGLQFTFDEDGYITNYTDVMTSLYTKLTEMEAHKNSLGTEEAQSEYEDSTLGPFRERVDELKNLVGQYDDTNQLLMDADNEYQEMIIEWQQNNYDQIVYKVELQVEFSELQLEQVGYYLDKIQDDWYSAAESVILYGDQIVPLTGNIQSYIGMLDELKTKLNNNEINQAQYMEGLKEVQSGLIDNINTLQDALESVGEYYLNTLDQINEKLDIQTSKFDGLTSVLEHYKEITTLINGEKDYKTLNNIVKSQRKLTEDQLAVSERKLTMYENQKTQIQSEIDKAKLLQDDKLRKQTLDKLEQDMAEIDNLIADEQSSIMEHITTLAELAMEELTNTLAEAKKRMEEAILGGEGLSIDSMLSQIERLNAKQEEYLTNTNKLYETNKLIRQAQMDMDKTDNQRAKQHYNDYIKYIEQLQQSGQLTQFELEMAQAEYDVLQKKIALEEAQEAKNQVRLTRDSEGNYGYVYTANQENIDKAEQEFADAQNARYNKALEGAKKYQDQYYQAVADMESALEELEEERANHLITDEEYERRRAEIVDTYLTIAETSYELYFKATGIMMEESSNNLLDYELKGVGNMENLRDATEQYIEDSNKAFTTYDQKIDEVALHSEENFGKVEEGIGDVEEASQDLLLEINNNLIPTMEKELAETLTNSMKQWYALATAIKTAREEAEKAMDVIQKETKLEGGFITDYSDEIAKELEKGEKADYEYINSLLAARDKKMGYLDTYDYSQMMEDYLAGDGKDTDAIYKTYELLREHKMEMWNNIDFNQMLKDHLASNGKIDDEKAKKILEARAQKINVLGVTDAISNEELIKQLTGDNTSATTETATVSEEKKEDSAAAPDLVVGNKIEVKSGTKWYGSSAGTGGTGTAKGGTIKYISEGSNYPYNIDGLGWIKKSDIVGYNTGGYTGDWGPEGKLAILHEKELVLNAQDTENFLDGIAVLREISQMLDNNALIASLGAINLHAMTIDSPADQILQQEVTIHADFPNVTDHNEIEIAIDNLINAASQHAYQV